MSVSNLRSPVIVIGMGHSGTTLVAEMLHKAGTAMYSGDLEANYDTGIRYERPLCQRINTQILGLSKKPKLLEQIWNLPLHPITMEQRELLYQEVGDGAWGFKDPRTTVTYPMWAGAFPDCVTLYVYRRHQEVLRSFFKDRRSLVSSLRRLRRGLHSWVHFNRMVLEHHARDKQQGRRSVLVKYEELMEHCALVTQIEQATGIALHDARNPCMRRNKVTRPSEAAFYRWATAGHSSEVITLTRELDAARLVPQASV